MATCIEERFMIDGLIRWSLAHRGLVLAAAAAFLVWGAWTAWRMPLDVLPDLTAPTVTVLTEAPGMDPLEIEALVTFPIESSLNGAAGVRRVRSATAVGVAVVWVEFDWGHRPGAPDVHREAESGLGDSTPRRRASIPRACVVHYG
jgi:Cu/Ag efflux pump CusA